MFESKTLHIIMPIFAKLSERPKYNILSVNARIENT